MKKSLLIVVLVYFFSGCIENNPDPSWIEITEWTLEENIDSPHNQGVLTQDFSNAWVYVNNKLLGVFELPCKVPILVSGSAEIRIFPAILNNGISATKKIYPFVEAYLLYADLVQNETLVINPVTKYSSSTQFWIEDFEGASPGIIEENSSQATMIFESEPNNSNTYGRVFLNGSQNTWLAYTTPAIQLNTGAEVFLEIDYYTTNNITTGLIAEKADGSIFQQINIQINAQEEGTVVWKKIYIDLAELVGLSQGVYFSQSFQATLDVGDSEGLIYIDNIKVVHF